MEIILFMIHLTDGLLRLFMDPEVQRGRRTAVNDNQKRHNSEAQTAGRATCECRNQT